MKTILILGVIILFKSFAAHGEKSDGNFHETIKENHSQILLHKVFKQDGLKKMSNDSKPFQWLSNSLIEIGVLDSIKFVSSDLIDNLCPVGNNTIVENDNKFIFQIPDYENEKGNGLDYKWFSIVWGIEYHGKKNEINGFIDAFKNGSISQEKLVNELLEIRIQVIVNVTKFRDDIWLPWCVEVGAIPSSPLIWLMHVNSKDRESLRDSLIDAGDLDRINKWVQTLQK